MKERFIVLTVDTEADNSSINYVGDSFTDAIVTMVANTMKNLCIYDAVDEKITKCTSSETLYIVKYSDTNALVGIFTENKIDNFKNSNFNIYDCNGNKVKFTHTDKKQKYYEVFPYIDFGIPTKKEKEEVRKKSSIGIEIENFDKLSNIERVKSVEKLCELMRNEYHSKISVSDDYLDDVRFTVRKSFEEKEKDFYTDFETAQLSCPVGYCVFDVITGECVYVKEKSIYDYKKETEEGMKYKEMWNKLKLYIKNKGCEAAEVEDTVYGIGMFIQRFLTEMDKLEKEVLK